MQVQALEAAAARSASRREPQAAVPPEAGASAPREGGSPGAPRGGARPGNGGQPDRGGAHPHLDREAIEREMLRHVLRDDSGDAAERWLELRGELPAESPGGALLGQELVAWRRERAAGREITPAAFVQIGWNALGDAYVRFVSELLASELVPAKTDFVRAVQDGHRRLLEDEQRQRRLAAAMEARGAARGSASGQHGGQGG
jgi:hypothetical protein